MFGYLVVLALLVGWLFYLFSLAVLCDGLVPLVGLLVSFVCLVVLFGCLVVLVVLDGWLFVFAVLVNV